MESPGLVDLRPGVGESVLAVEHGAFPLALGGLQFAVAPAGEPDWLAVAFNVTEPVATRVPRARRILLLTEPVAALPSAYVNQFGILVAPQPIAGFTGIWHPSHAALASFFPLDMSRPGRPSRWSHDDLVSLRPPEKRDALSAVLSRKTVLPGHRKRLRLVCALKAALGDRFDIYGDGFQSVPVKADAILPYKYHLVIENTVMPSYWTEKLADAFLGYALPVVTGPPDLDRWFPPSSFVRIHIDRPDAAATAIAEAIDANLYESRTGAIAEARLRVLRDERLCPVLARVIAAHPDATPRLATPETVIPMPKETGLRRVGRELRRLYWQIDDRLRGG